MGICRKFGSILIVCWIIILLFPLKPVWAQETIVGVVFSGRLESYFKVHEQLLKKNKNSHNLKIKFFYQKPLPDSLAWANAVRKLIAYDAEIIIAYGSGATEAAIYEAPGKPVIGVFVSEDTFDKKAYPKLALVQYRFPATSIIRYAIDLGVASRIGILESTLEPSSIKEAEALAQMADRVGIEKIRLKVSSKMELKIRIKLYRYSCILVNHSALVLKNLSSFKDFIYKERIPVISMLAEHKSLSLVSFEPDTEVMADALYEALTRALHGDYIEKTIYRMRIIYNLALSKKLKIEPSVKLITVADEVLR